MPDCIYKIHSQYQKYNRDGPISLKSETKMDTNPSYAFHPEREIPVCQHIHYWFVEGKIILEVTFTACQFTTAQVIYADNPA